VNLTVQRLFTITGRFQRPLYPGLTERLNLALTNPNAFDVNVTRAQVQLTGTDRPGCGTGNFAIAQIPLSAYPMTLRAGETQRLRDLGLASTQMPRIKMIDSTQNQDACKGAELTLTYRGRAQW
jgi:hypothetical protein